MGRDLFDGYNIFITAARIGFGGREWVATDDVADLIGCKRGHALRVMRAIPDGKGELKTEKRRVYLKTDGDFTAEELSGWVEMNRQKEKHNGNGKCEEEASVLVEGGLCPCDPREVIKQEIEKIRQEMNLLYSSLERRIFNLENDGYGKVDQPPQKKRGFLGLFAS